MSHFNSCYSGSQLNFYCCLEITGETIEKESWCVTNMQFLNETPQKSAGTFGKTDFWLEFWGNIIDFHQGLTIILNRFVFLKIKTCPISVQPEWLMLNRALKRWNPGWIMSRDLSSLVTSGPFAALFHQSRVHSRDRGRSTPTCWRWRRLAQLRFIILLCLNQVSGGLREVFLCGELM